MRPHSPLGMRLKRFLPALIVGAMILGVLVGFLINSSLSPQDAKAAAGNLSIITDIFLRLIKMIIAPLVFSTLVVGIAHMEDAAAIGRVGARSIAWFVLASLVSLGLGLLFVHLFQPGTGLALPTGTEGAAPAATALNLKDFVEHLVPKSIVEAMANNEILQIVVFSCFVGTAIAATENRAPAILTLMEQVVTVMLKITGYVMYLAPLV